MTARAFIDHVNGDGSDYLSAIRAGLAYVDFGIGLPAKPRVFVKPNLTFPSYRPGVMTSPAAVEALILALKDYTPHIWLGDSDSGGYNRFSMDEVYVTTGVAEYATRHGVEVVNLSHLPTQSVSFECRGRPLTLALPRLLTSEIDVLITMPVPKVHVNTGVSLTFKNQWGCIPEPTDRLRLHPYFKEVILEVNRAVKAKYAVIDGRYGLNGSGPLQGDPVELGWLCVTDDIGAGARVSCHLMQVSTRNVRHLRHAERQGWIPDLDAIEVNRDLAPFRGPKFKANRVWTDLPGWAAFHSPSLAHLAYFSKWAGPLHQLLYRFREPFYNYGDSER
ncbi:MAG: DUF362 domain-containing protein [Actinomycetota bacterium]|nr:DUF362 domain-containing protein [Actinomycetota bacterium]